MFFIKNLIQLNYFDLMTIIITIVIIVAVQIINTLYGLTDDKNFDVAALAAAAAATTTPSQQQIISGKMRKQSSEQIENGIYCKKDNKILASATASTSTSTSTSGSSLTSSNSLISSLPLSTSLSPASTSTSASTSALLSPAFISECERERDCKRKCNHECGHKRHSVNLPLNFNNWNVLQTNITTDNANDEFHEDEDAISLENLFPSDQSEIWQSKKISYIIDELIETESNYVNQLRKGFNNYGIKLQQCIYIPDHLKGIAKQQQLLSNIDEILLLHEHHIYPCMLRYQNNLQIMFDELSDYIENNFFYCYVIFMINKKASMQLWQENRAWFQIYQNEIKDKLGIDSFLVQPIQRLTKYPLLLKQLITEFYGLKCKTVLCSLCKLETRTRRLLELVNQAEELSTIEDFTISEITLSQAGYFRRSGEFEAYHHRSRKKFPCKVLLFDNFIINVECRKKRLIFRHRYNWSDIDLRFNSTKCFTLLLKSINGTKTTSTTTAATTTSTTTVTAIVTPKTKLLIPFSSTSSRSSTDFGNLKEEYDFVAAESLTHWFRWARKIMEMQKQKSLQLSTISIRMHIVLGVVFAIWFIWQCL